MAKYSYITDKTNSNRKIQVESAIRDGEGKNIANNYAKQNGSYEGLNSGTADQLKATTYVEDKVPYNFRTSGGSADIGNRVSETAFVGGSLVFNQLVQNGNFESDSGWYLYNLNDTTWSVSDNTATIVVNSMPNSFGQFYQNISITNGHKYLTLFDIKSSSNAQLSWRLGNTPIATITFNSTTNWQKIVSINERTDTARDVGLYVKNTITTPLTIYLKNVMYIDLTQMFGSTIANYIYTLETNESGSGVAWFKNYFPLNYYDYNSGTLLSTKPSEKISVGFNQWDEEWELGRISTSTGQNTTSTTTIRSKNYIKVIPNETYTFESPSVSGSILVYDDDKNYIDYYSLSGNRTITLPSNVYYVRFFKDLTTYNNDICIHLTWSGYRNGEYEEYVKHTYSIPSNVYRGIPKLDSDNNLYFDGDYVEPNGTKHKRYDIVDLGTLTWTYDSGNTRFRADLSSLKHITESTVPNAICQKNYTIIAYQNNIGTDKTLFIYADNNAQRVFIRDSAYTDAQTFESAMSGVYLIYELATPTPETTDTYTELQIVDDFGTEEIVCVGYDESTQSDTTISIPMGHDSDYYANLRDKLQRLPDMPENEGIYVVKYEDRQCEFYGLSTWLSANGYVKPTELSGYDNTKTQTLKNVSGVFTWVDDE